MDSISRIRQASLIFNAIDVAAERAATCRERFRSCVASWRAYDSRFANCPIIAAKAVEKRIKTIALIMSTRET
ncbi:MAG TPA: hypothetical protein DIW81_10365, partial [Planctomycetaceae bacterium]|nr:hypothetical protein [Planctomycetaceae bacterium]